MQKSISSLLIFLFLLSFVFQSTLAFQRYIEMRVLDKLKDATTQQIVALEQVRQLHFAWIRLQEETVENFLRSRSGFGPTPSRTLQAIALGHAQIEILETVQEIQLPWEPYFWTNAGRARRHNELRDLFLNLQNGSNELLESAEQTVSTLHTVARETTRGRIRAPQLISLR